MKFKLEIELGNDAMERAWDIAKALFDTANRIRNYNEGPIEKRSGHVADINGNKVGTWEVVD